MCQPVPAEPQSPRFSGVSRSSALTWLRLSRWAMALGIALMSAPASPRLAHACGGLFCSGGGGSTTTTQGGIVNQTAERILFIDNDDATVTAVIQILYQGPTEKFAWIVPVSGVPEVKVSSGVVLDALQQQTNPSYQVNIVRNCPVSSFGGGSSGGGSACQCGQCAASAPSGAGQGLLSSLLQQGGPVVTVEAAGSIGPYDYSVISVQPFALDPAQVALQWLKDNGFDAGTLAGDALRPYLQDGLNLLAFKLQKNADVGSIRPVMITYPGQTPSIPIKPTAVAANDDMGVLVWVAAKARTVPINYKTVELDQLRIDWFHPGKNYDAVVSAAADEAGGQAFVTESAGPFSGLSSDPTFGSLQSTFTSYSQAAHTDWLQGVQDAWAWQKWDGFDDALGAAAKLPSSLSFASFRSCMEQVIGTPDPATAMTNLRLCADKTAAGTGSGVSVDMKVFQQKLDELVITPVITTLKKLDAQSYLTRLYTKLSPAEMTVDPVFDQNPDAATVSNAHLAQGNVPCTGNLATISMQGATLGAEVNTLTWPVAAQSAPAAVQVLQYGKSGPPQVLLDNSMSLQGAKFGLAACSATDGVGPRGSAGAGAAGGRPGVPSNGGQVLDFVAGSDPSGMPGSSNGSHDGGCRAAGGGSSAGGSAWLAACALGWLVARRRSWRDVRA
jgi:hypothetical protein